MSEREITPVVLTRREQRLVSIAWELGRSFAHAEVADAIEEAQAAPVKLPVARSWEDQVAARLAEMYDHARVAQQRLAAHRAREIERDRACIEHGLQTAPAYESWQDVRAKVDSPTWARVKSDFWDDEAGRWKPRTPEAVRNG